MAIPRADGGIPARVKKLEDTVRRIQLMPSVSQAAVAPLAVAKSSVWYDSTAGNEPSYWNGTAWVPVRDETIAVAQGTADVAQSTAVSAAADAAAAVAATGALQTDLDAAEAAVAAAQADVDTLTGTTIPGLAADIAAAQADVDAILPITTTEISDDAITTPKIAALAITAAKIAADTITASQIAANAITASELAANAVTAGKIAAGTIVAADIAAGTITTAKLAATAIDGMTITGALIRTAATSTRVEVDSISQNQIRFFTGHASETVPGAVVSVLNPAGVGTRGAIRITAPTIGGSPEASLTLSGDSGGSSDALLQTDDLRMFATDDVTIQASDTVTVTSTGAGGVNITSSTADINVSNSGLGSFKFNGALVATTTPILGWTAPTLTNSWVDVAGSRAGYMKDGTGRVSLRGRVSGGASAGTLAIFTLPSGFRPSQSMEWTMRSGVVVCAVQVSTAGVLLVTANASTAGTGGVVLDSISFPTN